MLTHPLEVPGFVRNLPCPCGSGVKAKRCPGLWQARQEALALRMHYTKALLENTLTQQLAEAHALIAKEPPSSPE